MMRLKTLMVFLIVLLFSSSGFAALDNKGTDFILGFLPNFSYPNVELHLTSDVPTQVLVEYPVNSPSFTQTVTITPGNVTIVSLPSTASQSWSSGITANNSVRATSSEEFVCYMINRAPATSDASLAIPVDTFNTEYIVFTYDLPGTYNPERQFVVYAAYDTTAVSIEFPDSSTDSFTLDMGEGRFYQTTTQYAGTIITASRPIGVTSGNRCLNQGVGACDHVFEMLPPTAAWGTEILAANIPETSNGTSYGIVGSVDGTTVNYDGNTIAINRGEASLTNRTANDFLFTSDQPIMVAQIMWNRTPSGDPVGDPALGILTPIPQFMQHYTFSTVGGSQFIENNVTIIAQNSDVGTLTLDGAAIPSSEFSSIGTTGYSVARPYISDGVHTTASDGFHGITIEGFNSYDSYLYTGGALFQFINPVGDPWNPVCNLTGTGPLWNGSATDDTPSEDINNNGILDPGEDTNNNGVIDRDTGIFFVELAPGAENLVLMVVPFTPGDPMVVYTVEVQDELNPANGTIIVTDGAGNTCEVSVSWLGGPQQICDVNNDGSIDINDIRAILGARGTPASGPDDPADADRDGLITPHDAKLCIQDCDNPGCAP